MLALAGDINVVAGDIAIVEARESSRHEQTYEYKQSGLTIGINSPVISVIQTAEKMSDAADRTESSRYKALAAGATAFNIYNNLDGFGAINDAVANGKGPMSSGGIGLSVSLGSSKVESHSLEQSHTAKGSSMAAEGHINLIATGKQGEEESKNTGGNILIRGSDISANQNIALVANENIHILAAQNTADQENSSQSSSSSIGASFGGGGLASVSVSGSKSQGQGRGNEEYWSASHIIAGDALTLVSGKDVNLIGSQISGNTVIADIGGNLRIESLQDKASEQNSFKSSGGSLTVGLDLNAGASYNQSKGSAHGDYASVNDYGGIMAGDGGFQINVGGNTHLKGGVIASTEEAIQNNRNELITGTLTTEDIDNWSEYEAKSSSSNIGVGMGGGLSSLKPTGGSAGTAKESGSEHSTTTSGISGGEITITDEQKQQELTGKTSEETIEELNRDVITGELDTNKRNNHY